ncbi:MAG: M48 family metallopeptidase [Bacteroidales bacterium]|jgi:predicted Zn-dependent protease|nr:M48 family metallopeptidase [Bacteroidales bacterium]
MKKTLLILIFLYVNTAISNAQNNEPPQWFRLEAQGEMPAEFNNIISGYNADGSQAETKYHKEENNYIKQLLMSGKILYGDDLTMYLNSVTDVLLANDVNLRKEVKIYALKDETTNAFSTSDGFVFVNCGLLAQCQNEAEVAFVIAHEISHYVLKHGIPQDKTKEKLNVIEDFLKHHVLSREKELEADSLAFERFYKKSSYEHGAIMGVYDVLEFGNLPFDEEHFDRTDVEVANCFQFDNKYFLQNTTPVASTENAVDTFSTHPNLAARRFAMQRLLNLIDTAKPQVADNFLAHRRIARYEVIREQIMNDNYLKAYYNIFVLQKQGDASKYLEVAKVAALYEIATAKNTGNYSLIDINKNNVEGEFQRIVHFFKQITKNECAILSLRTVWQMLETDRKNKYLNLVFNDLIKYLSTSKTLNSLNKFSDYRYGEAIEENTSANVNDNKSKYDKLKANQKVLPQKDFKVENYMLVDLKQNADFISAFNNALLENEKKSAANLIAYLSNKPSININTNSLVVLNPYITKKRESKTLFQTDDITVTYSHSFEKHIKSIAKRCGFDRTFIISCNDKTLPCSYQVLSRLNDYSNSLNTYPSVSFESYDIENVSNKLGTSFINLVNYSKRGSNSRKNKTYKVLHSIISVFDLPALPFSIYQWLFPYQYGTLNFYTYDLDSSRIIYKTSDDFTSENTSDELKQELFHSYSVLNNINKPYGYLGKRLLVLFDCRLSPTGLLGAYSPTQSLFSCSYLFQPSVEYVLGKHWMLGASVQFESLKFQPDDYYNTNNFERQSFLKSTINMLGFGIYGKYYLNGKAPLGYYGKLQADFWTFTANVNHVIGNTIKENDFTFGFRIEFGKTIVVLNSLSIGTGISFGLLTSGYSMMKLFPEEAVPLDYARTSLLTNYIVGVNINVGILTF